MKTRYHEWQERSKTLYLLMLCSTSAGPIKMIGRVIAGTDGFQACVPVRDNPSFTINDDWREIAWVPTLQGAKNRVVHEVGQPAQPVLTA